MENNKVTSWVEHITPQVAQVYLTKNISNRPVKEAIVDMYAQQMLDGQWTLSNDAITFCEDGELMNGQHRLKAVCKSGVPCDFLVSRGLPRKAFNVMDNGYNRTAGNALFMDGVSGSNNVAAIVKRKLVLERKMTIVPGNTSVHGGASGIKVGNAQIVAEYYKHKDDYDRIYRDAKSLYIKSRVLALSDYGGFIAHLNLSIKHPYDTALGFFEELTEKRKVTNDVVTMLRQKIINDKLSQNKMTSSVKQKLIIKAWNVYVSCKSVKRLAYVEASDKDLWFL